MKYLFFTAAVLGIIPATVFMLSDRKIVRWMVLGLILPLLFFNSTAINFFSHEHYRGTARGLEISLIYIIAAAMMLTFFFLRGYRKICPDWGSRLYVLYFLLCIPSALNASNLLVFSFELWKMVMIHMVFLAIYYYLEICDGDVDVIFLGVAILVIWNSCKMLSEMLGGVYRVRGIFPHPNSMAMYMTIAGLLFFSRYFNRQEGRWTRVWLAVFIMASVSIVRSYSRGSLLCYPIGFFITLACSMWGGMSRRKLRCLAFIIPVALIGALLATPKIVERFEKAPKASGQTRKQLARAAVNMMKDKTLTGVGLNNWSIFVSPPYHYTEHHDRENLDGGNRNAMVETVQQDDFSGGIVETIYLLVGAECGVPCLLVLLCWFFYYWVSSVRLLKRLRHSEYFYIPAGLLGALTAIYLQSALEWVLKQQINFIWLVTIFGIVSYLNRHYRDVIALEEKKRAAASGDDDPAKEPSGSSETSSVMVKM